jgi:hypothetical protein
VRGIFSTNFGVLGVYLPPQGVFRQKGTPYYLQLSCFKIYEIFSSYDFTYLSKMKIMIATAKLYGNKVYYFQEKDRYTREFADPREEPIIYCSKDKMFEEWSTLEVLIIHDKKTEEEYNRSKHYV